MSWRCHMIEIVMKHTHVYRSFHLTIPKEWAVKHLLQKSDHDVILRVPGVEESWTVGYRWTPLQCQFRPGWPTFVLENISRSMTFVYLSCFRKEIWVTRIILPSMFTFSGLLKK